MNIKDFGLEPWSTASAKVGETYGKLTILAIGRVPKTYRYFAVCECACGSEPAKYRIDKLKSGHTTSCGCRQGGVTHGLSYNPLMGVWRHMIERCNNQEAHNYHAYGGRGIKVCEQWQDLRNFVADMEAGYKKGLQIERKDNNGDYTPGNCAWVTREEQARNKRSNIKLTYQERTLTLAEWSCETGMPYQTLWNRVQYGWLPERILTEPVWSAKKRCAKAREVRKKSL